MNLVLRPVTRNDLAALAELHALCFPEDAWDVSSLAGILAMPGASGTLALDSLAPGEVPLGLIFDVILGEEAEILTFGVAANRRRQGIARALLADLFARAGSRGARQVVLEVAADNGPALSLYEATGFRTVGMRRGYYYRPRAAAVDAWLLRRTLVG
jgi:ribosomal-protein-alanine N-acetyltransferase